MAPSIETVKAAREQLREVISKTHCQVWEAGNEWWAGKALESAAIQAPALPFWRGEARTSTNERVHWLQVAAQAAQQLPPPPPYPLRRRRRAAAAAGMALRTGFAHPLQLD